MHRISLAPVLSATRSRDSCWITSVSYVCQFSGTGTYQSLAERWSAGPAGSHRPAQQTHLAFSRISTTRHRLVRDSGRVSIRETRSPTPHAFCSSCAWSLRVRRRTLPYSACLTRSSTSTTTVLSILSLTTRPSRTLRVLRTGVVVSLLSLMRSPHPAQPRAPAHAHA